MKTIQITKEHEGADTATQDEKRRTPHKGKGKKKKKHLTSLTADTFFVNDQEREYQQAQASGETPMPARPHTAPSAEATKKKHEQEDRFFQVDLLQDREKRASN